MLALGLILANLKHDEAQFSKFWFLRGGSPYGPVLKIGPFFLALGLIWANLMVQC